MIKRIKPIYIVFILVILVAVVTIVLYNGSQEDADVFGVNSNFDGGIVPIADPGPTTIVCSDSSDCIGVCVEDECLVPSCNKTTNTCICLGIC